MEPSVLRRGNRAVITLCLVLEKGYDASAALGKNVKKKVKTIGPKEARWRQEVGGLMMSRSMKRLLIKIIMIINRCGHQGRNKRQDIRAKEFIFNC